LRVLAITLNTFREAVRNKVLYIILVFAVVMIFVSVALANISIGEQMRVIAHLGIVAMEIFGVLLAMFVGVNLVTEEIERRTIYTVLAQGADRWEFILGKFLGLFLTVAVNTALMSLLLLVILGVMGEDIPWIDLVYQMSLIPFEMAIVIAFAVLFSSFSTPILSAVLTFLIFVIGNRTESLKRFIDMLENHSTREELAPLIRAIYIPLPHLGDFNFTNQILHATERPDISWWPYFYAFFYSGLVLILAILIFRSRDIK
jgi:ABC-type transport system involved in multi-copper enzyme maturation permease subunit